jgi:CRP-like cAMP-binding protein
MVSVIGSTADGQSTEIGVIGREGIVGIDLLLGARSAQNGHTVQIADGSLRMPAEAVMDEFRRGGAFQSSILSFVRKFLSQVSQTAVCNRLHPLEQRLARWLLMCADRSPTPESLMLTQEFLSIMAGATRTSVTLAAIALRSAGFINYSRGKITILDREGLEDFSCECYSVVKESYEKA